MPVMTARRLGILFFEVGLHKVEGFACHGMDESVADDRLDQRREQPNAKSEVVNNLNEHAGRRLLEPPDDVHSFCPRFQMMKANFPVLAVDDLLGGPRNRNARADRGHDDKVPIGAPLEVTDVTIMREDFRPKFEVGRGLEDLLFRRLDNDGIAGVHVGMEAAWPMRSSG